MYDPDAPTSKRALEELARPKVREILVRIAKLYTQSEADAEDLVADALMLALDPEDSPWIKGKFLTHMSFLMRHVWTDQMRLSRARHEVVDSTVARDENTLSAEPAPDSEANRSRTLETLKRLGAQLLLEIGDKYPNARRCFELGAAGIEDAADQAAIIGCTEKEVYEAHAVLKRYGKRIREEWEQAEERRMREVREESAKAERKDEGKS